MKARQAGSLVRRHADDGRRKYRLTNKAPRAGVQLVVHTSIKMEVRGSQARGRPRVKWVDVISYDMNERGFEEVDTRKTVENEGRFTDIKHLAMPASVTNFIVSTSLLLDHSLVHQYSN